LIGGIVGNIVCVIGDLHIGSTTALSTPQFSIHTGRADETQTVHATKAQEWIYTCWTDYWKYVDTLAYEGGKKRKHRIIVICLGDVVDGNHHHTNQIMHEVADQAQLALDILQPVKDHADKFYGILGTEVHAGNNDDTEQAIYRTLQADAVDYQLTLNVDGCVIDVAHHSPMASLPNMYKILADYGDTQRPRYIIRGHRHVITDTGEEHPDTRMIITPSWQLKTTFGWKVATTRRSDIGGLIINNGIMDTSKLRYRAAPDRRVIINV
jgi:hypothetical protein